jgi:hypothetical protein
VRQAFSIHVHVAEVLAGTGVYKCSKNLWATRCAPEGRNNASSTVRGSTVLEWPLNLRVIWHSSVGVWKPLLIVMKWTAVMMLKIIPGTFKADSHIACRVHAVPMPCRAAKGLECVFPIWFTQCGRAWFTLAMPRPCHALTMPFFSRPRHSTAVERRPVGYLPAFGFFRLPRGVPRRLLSEAYHHPPYNDPYLRL